MIMIKKINVFVFLLYIICAITPSLGLSFCFPLMLIWGVTAISSFKLRVQKDWRLVVVLWLGYSILLRIVGFSTATWGNYGMYVLYFFPLLVFSVYYRIHDEETNRRILNFISIVTLVNLVYNIIMLYMYPHANQSLNYSDVYTDTNIGNTMFTALMLPISILWVGKAIYSKKVYWVLAISSLIYFILASKTVPLVCYIFFAFLIVLMKLIGEEKKSLGKFLIIIIVTVVLLSYKPILGKLAEILDDPYVSTRLNAIIEGDYSSTYLTRIYLMKLSFDTFMSHPLFGVGYVKVEYGMDNYINAGIGHHSELVDHLGRYGIVGMIFYLFIYLGYWRMTREISVNRNKRLVASLAMISFLVLAITSNTITVMSGIVVFFAIPVYVATDDCSKKQKELLHVD